MFESQKQQIADYRKNRTAATLVWVIVKLAIAYAITTYIDFGIFIVFGYIFYAIENTSSLQFINSQEIDLQLNILNQRISEFEANTDK